MCSHGLCFRHISTTGAVFNNMSAAFILTEQHSFQFPYACLSFTPPEFCPMSLTLVINFTNFGEA